jgi:hypothetical protein
MTRNRDLLALLREVDEQLASVKPSPRLEARLVAELDRRGRRPFLGGSGGRSLVLALGASASVVALGTALQGVTPGSIFTERPVEQAIELAAIRLPRTAGSWSARRPTARQRRLPGSAPRSSRNLPAGSLRRRPCRAAPCPRGTRTIPQGSWTTAGSLSTAPRLRRRAGASSR